MEYTLNLGQTAYDCESFLKFNVHSTSCCTWLIFAEDMWPGTNDGDEGEPDWVKTEREQFQQYRDKDKDGLMNRDEVRDWVMPDDYDHSKAEAKHLIYQADNDKVWSIWGEFWGSAGHSGEMSLSQ